jgi:hypothetical protein
MRLLCLGKPAPLLLLLVLVLAPMLALATNQYSACKTPDSSFAADLAGPDDSAWH